MSESTKALELMAAQSRRDFVKGLGAGALSASMLAGGRLLADEPGSQLPGGGLHDWLDDEFDDEEATPCDNALYSVDRQARLLGEINHVKCTPCDCPTVGHVSARTQINIETTFLTNSPCDEIFHLIGDGAVMRWALKNRYLRINGPCQTPLGVNSGTFAIIDAAGTVQFRGQVRGTLGFDPCAEPGSMRCCHYPRVHGMLLGSGVSERTQGCVIRWSYCGIEGTVPCEESNWDVGITGLLRCPCPTDPVD